MEISEVKADALLCWENSILLQKPQQMLPAISKFF